MQHSNKKLRQLVLVDFRLLGVVHVVCRSNLGQMSEKNFSEDVLKIVKMDVDEEIQTQAHCIWYQYPILLFSSRKMDKLLNKWQSVHTRRTNQSQRCWIGDITKTLPTFGYGSVFIYKNTLKMMGFLRYSSIILQFKEVFAATRAAKNSPTIGASEIKLVERLRATYQYSRSQATSCWVLLKVQWYFNPTRIIAINDKPITNQPIAPIPLLADVTVMITKTNRMLRWLPNKKPPNTVTPLHWAFHRLAVGNLNLPPGRIQTGTRKHQLLWPRMLVTVLKMTNVVNKHGDTNSWVQVSTWNSSIEKAATTIAKPRQEQFQDIASFNSISKTTAHLFHWTQTPINSATNFSY